MMKMQSVLSVRVFALLVLVTVGAALMASSAQAVELTFDLGSGTGNLYAPNDFHTLIPLGSLPANAMLKSVAMDSTLWSTDQYNWAAELSLLFDPTPSTPGGDGVLTVGPYYMSDINANLISGQNCNWANGYADPVSTINDTKVAGTDFSKFDLRTTALFVVNAFDYGGTGGYWSGTLKITYDIEAPPPPAATWTPTATGTYNWDNSGGQNNWTTINCPNARDAVADLHITYSGAQTINLNRAITTSAIQLGDKSGKYGVTIAGNGGSLIMDSSLGTASIARSYGGQKTDTISANILLNSDLLVSDLNGALTDGGNYGLVLSGNITGGKNLTKNGGGALMLTGSNNFSSVTLNAGYLGIADGNALGNATLIINGGEIESPSHSMVTLTNHNPIALNGDFSSHYGFNTGDGAITLSRAGIKVTGNVTLAGPVSGPGGLNALDITYVMPNGMGGGWGYTPAITLHAGPESSPTQQVVTLNGWGPMWSQLTISGVVSDGGNGYGLSVTSQSSAAKLCLAAANTYSGDTTVTSSAADTVGDVSVGIGHNLALQYSALVLDAEKIAWFGDGITTPTIGGLKGSTDTALAFAKNDRAWVAGNYDKVTALTLNPQSGTCVYSGNISNGAAGMDLIKTGAGTQVLAGNNTYSGATTVNGGKLVIAPGGAINSTSGIAIGPGEFVYDNASTPLAVAPTFAATGGILSGTGVITPGVTITGGNILSPGDGGGTLTLNGGLTLNTDGIIRVTNPGSSLAQVNGTYADSLGAHVLLITTTATQSTPYTFLQWSGSAPGLSDGVQGNWSLTGGPNGTVKNWVGNSSPDNWTNAASWDGYSGFVSANTTAGNLSFTVTGTGGVPVSVHDVVINPATAGIAVNGPASPTTVTINSMQVGGSNNSSPALVLGTGSFNVASAVSVVGNGTLNATTGALVVPVLNVTGGSAAAMLGNASGSVGTANVSAGTLTVSAGAVGTANLSGSGWLASTQAVPQVNVTGGAPTFSGIATAMTVTGGGVTASSGTIGAFNHNTGAGTSTLGAATIITGTAGVSAGTVNFNSTQANGTLALPAGSTGTVVVGPATGGLLPRVATADFSAGAGTVNAANPLAIASTLKLPGSITATLSGGTSFRAAGANLANTATPSTLTLSGGVLALQGVTMPTGLHIWLDASDATTLFKDTAGTQLAANGDTVALWKDKSGYNNNATQGANGGPQVVASNSSLNNKETVRFTQTSEDSNNYMTWATNPSSQFPTGASLFTVIHSNEAGTGGARYNIFGNAGGDERWVAYSWGESHPGSFRTSRANGTFNYNAWMPVDGNKLISLESDSSVYRMLIDGTQIGSDTPAYYNGSSNTWTIANRDGTGQALNGDIAEMLFFDHVLSPAEANNVGGYLATKYGLATSYTYSGDLSGVVNLPNTSVAATASSTLDLGSPASNHTLGDMTLTGTGTQLAVRGAAGLSLGNLLGDGTLTNGGSSDLTVTLRNGSGTFAGAVNDGATNKISLVKDGTGTLTLSAANGYSGSTTVVNGTLQIGAAGSINNTAAIAVNSAGTLDVSLLASPFTLVSGRTITVNGTVQGSLVVANGAVLTGAGSFVGTAAGQSVTVNGTISPGTCGTGTATDGVGTVTIGNGAQDVALHLGGTSVYNWGLSPTGAGVIGVTGAVTVDSGATVRLSNWGQDPTGQTYMLATWTSDTPPANIPGLAYAPSRPANTVVHWTGDDATQRWDAGANWDLGMYQGGAINIVGKSFQLSGVSIQGVAPQTTSSAVISPASGVLVTGPSATATVASLVLGNGLAATQLALQSGGPLTVSGLTTINTGATLAAGENFASNQLTVNGGTLSVAAGKTAAITQDVGLSGGRLAVNGTLNAASINTSGAASVTGSGSVGTSGIPIPAFTVTNGTTSFGGGVTANVTTLTINSAVNLNAGGTVVVPGITAPSGTVNFNGGALKASADLKLSQIGNVVVQSGGAVIDSNGHTANIAQTLTHDAGGPAIDGGLTAQGSGVVVVTASQSYTGATNVINGGTLKLQGSALPTAPPVAGYAHWFDASSSSNLTLSGSTVNAWYDKGAGSANATPQTPGSSNPMWVANSLNGLGAVHFTSSQNLLFSRDSSIRTVFSIFKGASFLLTDLDAYNFHRSEAGGTDSDPTVGLWGHDASGSVTGGTTYLNGSLYTAAVDAGAGTIPDAFNLIAVQTTGAVQADGFNRDRVYHSGDQYQGEVIIYDSPLTTEQVQSVENYLNAKWSLGLTGSWVTTYAGGTNLLPPTTPVSIAAGSTLDLSAANQQIASLSDYGGAGGTVTNSGASDATLTVSGNASTTFSGVISDGASKIGLFKAGPSTLTLSGSNTYTGETTAGGGVLAATDGMGLPRISSLTLSGGGVLQTTGTFNRTVADDTGANVVTWYTGGGGFAAKGGDLTVSLAVGSTAGATLRWGAGGFAGNGNPLVFGSAGADSSVIWTNPIAAPNSSDNVTIDAVSGSIATPAAKMAATISGSGSLTKTGPGTLALTTSNNYTGGTHVDQGTLLVSQADALPAGRNLSIAGGGHVVLASGLSHAISLGGLTITSGAGASFGAGLPTPPTSGPWSGDPAPTPNSGQAESLTYGSAAPTPEPGTLALLVAGAVGLLAAARRRK